MKARPGEIICNGKLLAVNGKEYKYRRDYDRERVRNYVQHSMPESECDCIAMMPFWKAQRRGCTAWKYEFCREISRKRWLRRYAFLVVYLRSA